MRYTVWVALLATAALGVWPHPLAAENVQLLSVASEALGEGRLKLEEWSYLADDPTHEVPMPDGDAEWEPVSSALAPDGVPSDWSGSGWFALDLEITSATDERPLALRFLRHHGASRVFLDGELVGEIGRFEKPISSSHASPGVEPVPLLFDSPGRHRVVVQYANPEVRRFHRVGYVGGFVVELMPLEAAISEGSRTQRVQSGRRSLFGAVFLSFGLLHFLLWLFRRVSRDNLFFALMSLSLAVLAFLLSHKAVGTNPRIVFWSESVMNAAGIGFALFGVLFVHSTFGGKVPRWLHSIGVLAIAILLWAVWQPKAAEGIVFLVMLGGLIEMARTVVLATLRRRPGALIVAAGILLVVLGFGAGLLANLGFLPRTTQLTFVAPFISVLLLIVSMSVYLARRVAQTHRDLELQLERVRSLSEEKLEQERRVGQERTRRLLLEAEMERKQRELEEARELQLALLPRDLPAHPELTIGVHMTTATEVGGDYYDFDFDDGGALTLAVGDATGHGMRAGTMVTATKSLFNALGRESDLLTIVGRSNSALKRMNLRALNMALLLGRYQAGSLQVASAGMPYPLVYRAASEGLECIEIGGMPLGSVRSFPYRSETVTLLAGDAVLFMSDGFPELHDARGEILGYDRAAASFQSLGAFEAPAIIDGLVDAARKWAGEARLEDDVTFVVLKVR